MDINDNNIEAYYLGRFLGLVSCQGWLTHDELKKSAYEIKREFETAKAALQLERGVYTNINSE
jgi:hypothetical protein